MSFLVIIILLFSSYIISFSNDKGKYLFFIITFTAIITYIIATRDQSIPDTEPYINGYLYNADIFDFKSSPFEKGYTVLMRTSKLIFGDNYDLFFAIFPVANILILLKSCNYISSAITNQTKYIEYKEAFNPLVLLLIYFSYYGIYHNAIVLRAGISTSLVFLSLAVFLKSDKFQFKSLLIFIIASLFHSSALVCVPMFWIAKTKKFMRVNARVTFLLIIMCIYLISPLLNFIMEPINQLFLIMEDSKASELSKFSAYNNNSLFVDSGMSFKFMFFYFFGWLFSLKNSNIPIADKFLRIYLIGLSIWALFRPLLLIERITDFYTFMYIPLAMIYFYDWRKSMSIAVFLLFACSVQFIFIYRLINAHLV